MPCNTGPFPDANGVETDTRSAAGSLPAIIESIKPQPSETKINIRVREADRPYALQLFSASGQLIKEVLPYQSFSTGLQTISIPKETLSGGFGYLALVDEDAIIDVDEFTGDQ